MSIESSTLTATLRKIADLLAEHPDMPIPYTSIYDHSPDQADLSWYFHISERDSEATQKALAQSVIKALGGKWDKNFSGEEATFKQKRDGLDFHIAVKRDAVCRRIVTGTETITRLVHDPATPMVEVTEEVETVEWKCEPLLAGEAA